MLKLINIYIGLCCGLICISLLAVADSPKMLKDDAKEAAKIQRLLGEMQVKQAEISLILQRYATTHNCPTGRATVNVMAIVCELSALPMVPPGTN